MPFSSILTLECFWDTLKFHVLLPLWFPMFIENARSESKKAPDTGSGRFFGLGASLGVGSFNNEEPTGENGINVQII